MLGSREWRLCGAILDVCHLRTGNYGSLSTTVLLEPPMRTIGRLILIGITIFRGQTMATTFRSKLSRAIVKGNLCAAKEIAP